MMLIVSESRACLSYEGAVARHAELLRPLPHGARFHSLRSKADQKSSATGLENFLALQPLPKPGAGLTSKLQRRCNIRLLNGHVRVTCFKSLLFAFLN